MTSIFGKINWDKEIKEESIIELGDVVKNSAKGQTHENQITIADLTGVAVQDVQAANIVVKAYLALN